MRGNSHVRFLGGPSSARKGGYPPKTQKPFMNYPHPIIAREGWPFIAIAVVVALVIHTLGGLGFAWPFWLIVIFIVQFFRDPPRPIPQQDNAVLCPADGRIVAV